MAKPWYRVVRGSIIIFETSNWVEAVALATASKAELQVLR